MERLKGKNVIVTGGAGGIGRAGVELFAAEGAHVIIADIDEKTGQEAASAAGAKFVRCDVSNSEDVRKVIAAANGKLDVLYNNAGVFWNGRDGRITDIDEAVWEKVIAINLRSVFLFCKYALPLLMKNGGSVIKPDVKILLRHGTRRRAREQQQRGVLLAERERNADVDKRLPVFSAEGLHVPQRLFLSVRKPDVWTVERIHAKLPLAPNERAHAVEFASPAVDVGDDGVVAQLLVEIRLYRIVRHAVRSREADVERRFEERYP